MLFVSLSHCSAAADGSCCLGQLDASPAGRPLALSYAEGCLLDRKLGGSSWAAGRSAQVAVRLPAAAPAIKIPTKSFETGTGCPVTTNVFTKTLLVLHLKLISPGMLPLQSLEVATSGKTCTRLCGLHNLWYFLLNKAQHLAVCVMCFPVYCPCMPSARALRNVSARACIEDAGPCSA